MVDFTRLYHAQRVECLKCDNWEEMGGGNSRSDLGQFTYDYDKDHYTCEECKTNCVQYACITEYRDDE